MSGVLPGLNILPTTKDFLWGLPFLHMVTLDLTEVALKELQEEMFRHIRV